MLSFALTFVFYAFIAFSHSVEADLRQRKWLPSALELNETGSQDLLELPVVERTDLGGRPGRAYVLTRLNITLFEYATGGATVNSTRTPAVVDEVTCLHVPSALEQIEAFVKKANSSLDHDTLEYTLFAIWIGANDIITMVDSNISVTGAEIVDDIFVGIEKLKAVGEKAASVLTDTTLDLRKALFSVVDAQTAIARNMSSMHAMIVLSNGIVVVDMFRAADEIYQHPLAYELSKIEINQSCVHGQSAFELKYVIPVSLCTDSDVHFFWDSMHLTRKVHSLFSKAAAASLLKAGWISQR
ncbi:SGNH hydrolase-type esterase domain [Phaffia rhodozyma]|uniref:SGNH hydrolase-type esterase domain n=1 Tax=Phaffia rhodozyma TaxID=264483 RepID=A0A0F7SPS8_PHARH|nr:SGNH hydrolase-type esterase domain [Phaffia rhodozyma]